MNKVVFTLAAVSVVCACGLVIDPDKLVEGNGTPLDTPDATTDTTTTETSVPDASEDATVIDAETDGPEGGVITVDVPECVPVKPTPTAEGPYAVVIADAAAPTPACPPGYLASPVTVAKTDFEGGAAQCNNIGACTCAAPVGTPTCSLRLYYYEDSACTNFADSPTSVSTSCSDVDSENYVKLQYNIGGVTCTSNGPKTTAPSLTPTAAYKTQFVICSPDPSVQLAACKTGEIALPQAANAAACVAVPSDFTCAGSAYGAYRFLSKSGTFTDSRTCTCGCTASQASCTGGSATTYDNLGCSQNPKAMTFGQCTVVNNQETVLGTLPSPATAACAARAFPSGEATPAIDLKLCCLGTGGN